MTKILIPLRIDNIENSDFLKEVPHQNLDDVYIEKRFGRSKYYGIYNTKDNRLNVVNNENHHFGGTKSPVEKARENDVEVVIASHMGFRPYTEFEIVNIPIYLGSEDMNLSNLIHKFGKGDLQRLQKPKPGTCCSSGKH